MKAIVQDRFGPPDVLRLADVDPPEPGPDDVLVRVPAAGLNPYDWHMLRGDPLVARLMGGMGLRRPAARVAGVDAAGRGDGGRRERQPAAAGGRGAGLLRRGARRVRAGQGGPGGAEAGRAELRAGRGRPDGGADRPAGTA